MRQGTRLIVAALALVLGLHVLMLAGLGAHDHRMEAAGGPGLMAGVGPAGPLTTEAAGSGHDMAAACLAVLAGILLLGAGLGGTGRRWTPERRHRPAAPVAPPPSPPPIALGVLRT